MNIRAEATADVQPWPRNSKVGSVLDGAVDVEALIAAFRRRSKTFIFIVMLALSGALISTLNAVPRYTSTASVMLDPRKRQVIGASQVDVLSSLPPDTSTVDSEVQVIKSRTLATRLVDRLNLLSDPEFNDALRSPTLVQIWVAQVKSLLPMHRPSSRFSPAAAAAAARDGVVDAVIAAEDVRREGLTFVINISMSSRDPQKAELLATTLTDLYMTAQLEAKFDANKRANTWLSQRLSNLQSDVNSTEHAAADYQARNGLLATTGSNLTEQRVSDLMAQESQARADYAAKRAQLSAAQEQLANGGTGEELGAALDSPVIRDLRVKLAEIHQTQAELLTRYGPQHPNVANAEHEAGEIEAAIHSEIQRIIGGLQSDTSASAERLRTIADGLESARGALATSKGAQVGLDSLQRNADVSRTLYSAYLERFKQTSTGDALQTSDAQVVSLARIPMTPSSPKLRLNLLLGLLSGVLGGGAAVFLLESLDNRVRTALDVEQKLKEVYIGSVPLVRARAGGSPADLVVDRPLSAFAEALRHLRVALVRAHIERKVKVIVVTSALPGEGKTTTALALARSAATGGASVLAIDCDLRRRSLTQAVLPRAPEIGLLEVLTGEVCLEEVLLQDPRTDLKLLPISAAKFTSRDVFGSLAMARLISELREKFDYIIIDCPPVLPISDAKTLAGMGDAVLFLVGWQQSKSSAVNHGLATLRTSNVRVSGIALSKVNLTRQAKHGYGDAGYYYNQYRGYFVE